MTNSIIYSDNIKHSMVETSDGWSIYNGLICTHTFREVDIEGEREKQSENSIVSRRYILTSPREILTVFKFYRK